MAQASRRAPMNRLRERITTHPDDRPGLHAARLQPRHRRCHRCGREVSTFIPALAYTFAHNPTEIEVAHEERAAGESKYSLYKLIRLNFDLITGFSLVPLQVFSLFGMLVSVGVDRDLFRRDRAAPAAAPAGQDGIATLWDRDILAFFLIGMMLFGLGPARRIRRPHLPAGARAPALPDPGDPRAAMPDSLRGTPREPRESACHDARRRLRLSRCRRALPARCCSRTASTSPLVVTHADDPAETIWFDSVANVAAELRHRGHHAGRSERARRRSSAFAALRPDFMFSFYYRQHAGPPLLALPHARRAEHARLAAAEIPRPRAGQLGRSSTARRETGATLHYMTAKPDAGDIVAQHGACRSCRTTRRSEVFDKVTVAAEIALYDALPALIAGDAPRSAAGRSRTARYFGGRKPEDGRIDWTQSARRHPRSGARRRAAVSRRFTHADRRVAVAARIAHTGAQTPRRRGATAVADVRDGRMCRAIAAAADAGRSSSCELDGSAADAAAIDSLAAAREARSPRPLRAAEAASHAESQRQCT